MEVKEYFPVKVYQEDLSQIFSNDQLDRWVEILKKLEYHTDVSPRDHITINEDVLDLEEFKELKKIALDRSQKFCEETSYLVEDVQISNSWAYLIQSNNFTNNWHFHSNSSVSGVFYLTEGSELRIMDPKLELHSLKPMIKEIFMDKIEVSIKVKKNSLVIFPSYLNHCVGKSKDILRVSIPFNVIPKGRFGPTNGKINF